MSIYVMPPAPDELPEPPANALVMNIKITPTPYFEYSALTDGEGCINCSSLDGKTAGTANELPATPNLECTDPNGCRCVIVKIEV